MTTSSNQNFLKYVSDEIQDEIAGRGMTLDIQPIDFTPVLHDKIFVGSDTLYPVGSDDVVLSDDEWQETMQKTALSWLRRNNLAIAETALWYVYTSTKGRHIYTSKAELMPMDGGKAAGFIYMTKENLIKHNKGETDINKMRENEISCVDRFLCALSMYANQEIFDVKLKKRGKVLEHSDCVHLTMQGNINSSVQSLMQLYEKRKK